MQKHLETYLSKMELRLPLMDAAMNKIENFTIDAGCNLNVNGSTSTPIPLLGNLVVNGNINGTTSGAGNFILSMSGSSPQTISGSGSITVTGFVVGDHSTVTLEKNITVVGVLTLWNVEFWYFSNRRCWEFHFKGRIRIHFWYKLY